MLKQRVVTAVILAVGILLAIFFLPDWALGGVIAAVIVLALNEWCVINKIGKAGFALLALACGGAIVYCGFVPLQQIGDGRFLLCAGYLLSMSFWLFSAPTFLYFKMEPVGLYWRYGVAMMLTIPTGLAVLELRHQSPWLLTAALLLVCLADICAYFTGRAIGKHKLAPEISPGKTWEGAIGAVVGVQIYCLALWVLVPGIRNTLNLFWVIILGLVYVLVSIMGDLFESLIKREAGVKDSGTLLPGHGGVLDRVDSMLAYFPFAGATLLTMQWLG